MTPLPAAPRGSPDKVGLRREALARRAALGATDVAAFDAAVPDAALALVTRHAATLGHPPLVALYSATSDEAPTAALAGRLTAAGLALALPIIGPRDAPLTFRRWHPGDTLQPGPFGILQPCDGAVVEPDMLFVPLLAFDAAGRRLGYGGGYYDRTLAALSAKRPVLTVGLAFAVQQIPAVPQEPHDIALDTVLTECGLAVDRRPVGVADELTAIFRRIDALPDLDTRSADEIIGYDENGLPRR